MKISSLFFLSYIGTIKLTQKNKYVIIFKNYFLYRKNFPIFIKYTLLVQLVERRFPKPDVVGSSPTGRE